MGMEHRQPLAFKARIEHAKWVERGDSVTCWGRVVAPERMRIGALHVGFYDGIRLGFGRDACTNIPNPGDPDDAGWHLMLHDERLFDGREDAFNRILEG